MENTTNRRPKLYGIDDNTSSTRGFPWAYSADPTEWILYECLACHTKWRRPSGRIMLTLERDKGTKWGDVLGVGSGAFGLYVSEYVKQDWDEAGIDYGPCVEAVVEPPHPKRLEGTSPPLYYWIGAHKGAEIDHEASENIVLGRCEECGRVKLHPRSWFKHVLILDTWDGSDLFYACETARAFCCTERVVQLAAERGRMNFRFMPIDENGRMAFKGIRYLKRTRKRTKK